jgi:VWFA-related protein
MQILWMAMATTLISFCFFSMNGLNGQSQKAYQVKVDVDLVTTDVTVIGKPVSELRREDFAVYDNGVAQPITYYSHDELPLAVVLLVDVSGSITDYLASLKLAALSCLRPLNPQDEVALISFSSGPKKQVDLRKI